MSDPIFAVVALLTRPDPKDPHRMQVLAVSRKGKVDDLGLPGGKIDPGESVADTLLRELKEETGLSVLEAEEIFLHPDRGEGGENRPCLCFHVTKWIGEPSAQEEGTYVGWVPLGDLLTAKCSFAEYNARLFDHQRLMPRTPVTRGAPTQRDWTPSERYQLYLRGWKDGANIRAMDPFSQEFPPYGRGYADGRRARSAAAEEYAKEIGHIPMVLRLAGDDQAEA
jgi:ADP-ribose pyrophosphatase YjhB (NUDIX family)